MIKRLLLSFLFIIILGILIYKTVDVAYLVDILREFPKDKLILLLSLSTIISILKSWRFLILLKNVDVNITFWENLKAYIAGQAASPIPGGEAMRAYILNKKRRVKAADSTGPIIVHAFIDLIAAAIFALIGSLVFEILRVPAILALAIFLGALFIASNKKIYEYIFQSLPQWKIIRKIFMQINKMHQGLIENVIDKETNLPDKIFIRALSLALLTQIVGGIVIWQIALTLSINLNPIQSIFIYSSSIVIQGLSTPGGIGFVEGGVLGILLLSQVEFSKAVALILIFRLVTLLFNIILGLIFLGAFYYRELLLKK